MTTRHLRLLNEHRKTLLPNVPNLPIGEESAPKTSPVTIEIKYDAEATRKAFKDDLKRKTVRVKSVLP